MTSIICTQNIFGQFSAILGGCISGQATTIQLSPCRIWWPGALPYTSLIRMCKIIQNIKVLDCNRESTQYCTNLLFI